MPVQQQTSPQYDRITEMLRQQAQTTEPTQGDYEAMALGNLYNPGQFVQGANQMQQQAQDQGMQAQMNLLKVFEAKKAAGDAHAKALDDKIQLFTGGDPEGAALFLQELHNDPEQIDPSNSYQVLTKLAGIKKRTGYESPMLTMKRMEEEAKIAKLRAEANAPKGGATGELIKNLMAENPNMTFEQALYQVQTGMRQGTKIVDGKVVPIPGLADALGKNEFGKESGKKAGGIAGTTKQEAANNLPAAEDSAKNALDNIASLIIHPGFKSAVGWQSPFPTIAGGDAADFEAELAKLSGGTFLEAYQNLRGTGAISEAEGKEAKNAIASLQTSQSEQQFLKSLATYEKIIKQGLERARNKALLPVTGVPEQTPAKAQLTTPEGYTIRKKGE